MIYMYSIRDMENAHQVDTFELNLDDNLNFESKEEFDWWNKLADSYQYLEDAGVYFEDIDWDYELEGVIALADRVRGGIKEVLRYVKFFGNDHANLEIEPCVYLKDIPYFDREGNEIGILEAEEIYSEYEMEHGIWEDDTYLGYINNHIQEKVND